MKKSQPFALTDTKKFAENLLENVRAERESNANTIAQAGALVIGLYGDLGAGKTTFMQFFGESLGIKEKILSPTFVIEKIYKIDASGDQHEHFDHLIHIDAYRLDSPDEMLNLGWEEIIKNPRNIICVEWADRIENILPADCVRLKFLHHDEVSRVISLK